MLRRIPQLRVQCPEACIFNGVGKVLRLRLNRWWCMLWAAVGLCDAPDDWSEWSEKSAEKGDYGVGHSQSCRVVGCDRVGRPVYVVLQGV